MARGMGCVTEKSCLMAGTWLRESEGMGYFKERVFGGLTENRVVDGWMRKEEDR